jgi:hypothetical protein
MFRLALTALVMVESRDSENILDRDKGIPALKNRRVYFWRLLRVNLPPNYVIRHIIIKSNSRDIYFSMFPDNGQSIKDTQA